MEMKPISLLYRVSSICRLISLLITEYRPLESNIRSKLKLCAISLQGNKQNLWNYWNIEPGEKHIKFYNVTAVRVLTCECKSWAFSLDDGKNIETDEIKTLRRISGCSIYERI